MEVKVGVQNVAREIVIDTDSTAKEIGDLVAAAIKGGSLQVTDTKGRVVVVPSAVLAYVEIGVEEQRKVGFGS